MQQARGWHKVLSAALPTPTASLGGRDPCDWLCLVPLSGTGSASERQSLRVRVRAHTHIHKTLPQTLTPWARRQHSSREKGSFHPQPCNSQKSLPHDLLLPGNGGLQPNRTRRLGVLHGDRPRTNRVKITLRGAAGLSAGLCVPPHWLENSPTFPDLDPLLSVPWSRGH